MPAITVRKKSKIGFKAETPGEFASGDDAAGMGTETAQGPVLTRFEAPPVDSSSYTLAGICGIVALLIFIAILAFQYLENDYYKDAFYMGGAYVSSPAPAAPAPTPAASAPAPAPAAASSEQPAAASAPAPAGTEQPAATAAPAADGGGTTGSKVEARNEAVNNEVAK